MLTNIINHEEHNMTLTFKVKGQGHSRPTIGFRSKGIMNHASHTRGLSQLCVALYLVIFQGMLKTKQQFTMKPKNTMIESSDRVSREVALFL